MPSFLTDLVVRNAKSRTAAYKLSDANGLYLLVLAAISVCLGQGWRDTAEELDDSELQARAEPFSLQSIPTEVRVITAGEDVQRDRVEITFLGFSETETLVLGHSVIWGDPKDNTTWA